jgi:hypothetical protein
MPVKSAFAERQILADCHQREHIAGEFEEHTAALPAQNFFSLERCT